MNTLKNELYLRKMLMLCRDAGRGEGNSPLPVFARSVNPISTRGQIMPTQLLVAPSKFWTMRHLCYVNDKALDKKRLHTKDASSQNVAQGSTYTI